MAKGESDKANALAAIDLLLNLLMLFVVISAIAITKMSKPSQEKAVELKAEMVIELTWSDLNFDDLDLWILLPDGKKVGFTNKDVGVVTLDRDDRGGFGDTFVDGNGATTVIAGNKEVAAIRANLPGRYVVNIHYFHDFGEAEIGIAEADSSPNPVVVKLTKLNPRVDELISRKMELGKVGSQRTAFCFTLDVAGKVTSIDQACSLPFVPTSTRHSETGV